MTVLVQCLALSSYSSSADAGEDAMLRCFLSLFEAPVQRVLLRDSQLKLCGRKEGRTEGGLSSTIAKKICRIIIKTILQLTFLTDPIWPDPKAIGFWIWTNMQTPLSKSRVE